MTTREFIKKLEEAIRGMDGLEVIHDEHQCEIWIENEADEALISVGTKMLFGIGTYYEFYERLDRETAEEIFDTAIEYAKTPLEDRENEKKYRVKIHQDSEGHFIYSDGRVNYIAARESGNLKMELTKEDAEKLAKSIKFEVVEVEND